MFCFPLSAFPYPALRLKGGTQQRLLSFRRLAEIRILRFHSLGVSMPRDPRIRGHVVHPARSQKVSDDKLTVYGMVYEE